MFGNNKKTNFAQSYIILLRSNLKLEINEFKNKKEKKY